MEHSAELIFAGSGPPLDIHEGLTEADQDIASIVDVHDRKVKAERLVQIKKGGSDVIIVRKGERPVGIIMFRSAEGEATLRFGHILSSFIDEAEEALSACIGSLASWGFVSILSLFNWPQHDRFVLAAERLGFKRVDRLNKVHGPERMAVKMPLPVGIDLRGWTLEDIESSSTILFENSYPGDRVFHRAYRTREGCKAYIESILDGRYGMFMPQLSRVAFHDDVAVGILLATRLEGFGINIVDLAVDAGHHGQGIGRALIAAMADANAVLPREDIHLTVTRSNTAALRLYQKIGFRTDEDVAYFTYEI